jgi:hypothetical protein
MLTWYTSNEMTLSSSTLGKNSPIRTFPPKVPEIWGSTGGISVCFNCRMGVCCRHMMPFMSLVACWWFCACHLVLPHPTLLCPLAKLTKVTNHWSNWLKGRGVYFHSTLLCSLVKLTKVTNHWRKSPLHHMCYYYLLCLLVKLTKYISLRNYLGD